jgi:hypothetical protein
MTHSKLNLFVKSQIRGNDKKKQAEQGGKASFEEKVWRAGGRQVKRRHGEAYTIMKNQIHPPVF